MEVSVSKPMQWLIKEFGEAYAENGKGQHYIKIPKFQRSLVWVEEQRRALVDSLYRGFPIGAILGYQVEGMKGNRNIIQIVDGLQRSTTIFEYLKAPLFYAPVDRVFSEEFVRAVVLKYGLPADSNGDSVVYEVLETWMRQVKTVQLGGKFNSTTLFAMLAEKFGPTEAPDDFVLAINVELGQVQLRVIGVESIAIPVILYSGDVANIPTIFELINNKGVKLSKYEILASSWVSSQTRISNPSIRKAIQGKYDVLIDQGFEIDGLSEDGEIEIDKFNLYEYLFGLGKVLEDKHEILFGSLGSPDESSPTGFVLVTTALKLRNSKMGDLESVIKSAMSEPEIIDLSKLESALLDARDQIHKAIAPHLKVKLHNRETTSFVAHSQNQILSLIASYLVNAYNTSTWEKLPEAELAKANQILKHAAAHYLLDIVTKRWRGSGDSRLYEMVWQGDDGDLHASDYYTQPVSPQIFKAALIDWHEEQLRKNQKKRQAVDTVSQAILKFLYSGLVTVLAEYMDVYELEHLYPVAVLANRILELQDEGWPISALGNLTLLEKDLNRIKGKNMLGDYLPSLIDSSEISNSDVDKIQKYLISPSWEEIRMSNLDGKERYMAYCRERMLAMTEVVMNNLKML
jgi:hypothetical protein